VSAAVMLVDLSSIAHPIWHVSGGNPDVNTTSTQTVARIRALAAGIEHVAICCDNGRSFRADIDPQYKANRPERDAALTHQIKLAQERLAKDGFPVWSVKGFEADDLIATAVHKAAEIDAQVLVVSADKDLLQLVGPKVMAKSPASGVTLDVEGVVGKFGVKPEQMRDYLTLVGDTADNIKGATGIGPKKAAALLTKFGDLDTLYAKLDEAEKPEDLGLKPAEAASLEEFRARYQTVRSLIALRTDVEIPFSEVLAERRPKDADTFGEEETMETTDDVIDVEPVPQAPGLQEATRHAPEAQAAPASALAVREPEILSAAPAEWERALDPRSMEQARSLAKDLFASRMFSAYGNPQAVLATMMVGRELGIPAMSSLRNIYNVEGRHALGAGLMVALVLTSGLAEYFEPISFSETEATWETKRRGARNPVRLTHTIEMARKAGLVKPKSNWETVPTDMLNARAQARLARMIYPDRLAGLYTPEELAEVNGNG